MAPLWKALGAALLGAVLSLAVGKREKDLAAVLTMVCCVMAAAVGAEYLREVLDFLRELEETAGMGPGILEILLKAVGVGLLTQLAAQLCTDAGAGSLGQTLRLAGAAATLRLSLPVFRQLLEIIREITQ